MMSQADLLRSKGKIDEAKQAYESVMAQFPGSPIAQEAMRSARMLRK
jgi:TolA-binding protein